jgi:hypothetical protein
MHTLLTGYGNLHRCIFLTTAVNKYKRLYTHTKKISRQMHSLRLTVETSIVCDFALVGSQLFQTQRTPGNRSKITVGQ